MSSLCQLLLLGAVVATLCLVTPSQGQLIPEFLGWGYCSDIAPQKGIDLKKFEGTWFTIQQVPNQYVASKSCIYANYTVSGDGLAVHEFGKDAQGKGVETLSQIKSTGVDKPFTVVAEGVPEAPLKILATDYETYACLQSCIQYVAFKAEFAWIMTKKPSASAEAVKYCKDFMKAKMDFDNTQFVKVPQGRCGYEDFTGQTSYRAR